MGFLEDRDLSGIPSIPDYYNGKTILITGGSGFIGKLLIEKLLYSCSQLDRIYLLMRSKKGLSPEERLAKIYSYQCFSRLWTERPGVFEEKVHAVCGDVMDEGLGLSQDDRTLLLNRVNIIFHVAASVRFNDPLLDAVKMNLKGTVQMVDLANEVRNLSAFVHVSTSYCNTIRDPVEEVIYPPHSDWREILRVCGEIDPYTLRVLTPKYLGELPNTYTFTKQLAEHVVYEQRGMLPAVIVRPSVVISTAAEPIPGWVENFNGPVGIFVGTGKGILRVIHLDPNVKLDVVPADTTVKHLIASAWIRGTQPLELLDDIPVYHNAAIESLSATLDKMSRVSLAIAQEIPLDNILWTAKLSMVKSRIVYYILCLLFHLLPALILDSVLWISGNKPRLLKIQKSIFIANGALQPFVFSHWNFVNTNYISLCSRIKKRDRDEFSYDLTHLNYKNYLTECLRGGRKYLLKERDEDLDKAKVHLARIKFLEKAVRIIFYAYLLRWLYILFFKEYPFCF